MDSRRFFLLDDPCPPSSEIPKMMGRVVAYKLAPLQKFAPFKSSLNPHNPEDIIPDILPEPSLSSNRKDVLSAATDNGLKLRLGSLFGISHARNHEQKVELETKEVKTYALSNPDEFFDRLMENKGYAADVQKLFDGIKKRKAFFVTGFLTTSGASWTRTKGQGQTDGVNVTVPLSAISGVPLPGLIDPEVEPSRTVKGGSDRKMEVAGEEIFAMSYSQVKISYHFGANGFTKKFVIGPPKIADLTEMAFGETEVTVEVVKEVQGDLTDTHVEVEQANLTDTHGDVFPAGIEDEDEEDDDDDDDAPSFTLDL